VSTLRGMRKYSTVRASANEFGGMMQISPLKSTKEFRVEVLRVDDGRVDVGEDLELGRTAHVVTVARRAVGDDALAVHLAHLAGLEGFDHALASAMRRIQRSDLMLTSGVLDSDAWCRGRGSGRERQPRGRAARDLEIGAADRAVRVATTVGRPASVSSRMRMSSGSAPSSDTRTAPPSALRRRRRKSLLVAALRADVGAHFSTTPSTGMETFWNMRRPLRASSSAMSCGVVTMTAPLTGTRCASVSWMSPVPGGMSTTR